jgi:hypothetical protein
MYAFTRFRFFRALTTLTRASVIASLLAYAFPASATLRTVTSLADSGAGTLRDTIAASAAGDTIIFSVTGVIGLTKC